jgi:hypothetical protein
MSRRIIWPGATIALPTLAGSGATLTFRGNSELDRAFIVAMAAIASFVLLAWVRRWTTAPPTAVGPYQGEKVQPLAQLARVQRAVAFSSTSALEYEHRIQPDLRHVAAARLRLRHGIDLDRDSDQARALLGEDSYRLLTERPGRDDRRAPAPSLDAILALIDTLEGV